MFRILAWFLLVFFSVRFLGSRLGKWLLVNRVIKPHLPNERTTPSTNQHPEGTILVQRPKAKTPQSASTNEGFTDYEEVQ